MTSNTTIPVRVNGHSFQVAIHDNYWELYAGDLADSKNTVLYMGPFKKPEEFSATIQQFRADHPEVPCMWRKCKTVLKIHTRCNEDVWTKAGAPGKTRSSAKAFLAELCAAHIPVVNRFVQGYRLATYDYFAFEVASWDVPRWLVEREGITVGARLLEYRGWDIKPAIFQKPGQPPVPYELIRPDDLGNQISAVANPGEFELLDALNFTERGDYAGAVRRVTTAIEVLVESVVERELEASMGRAEAERFIRQTRTNFQRRVHKYQELTGRTLSTAKRDWMKKIRDFRHGIVHQGYRPEPGERGNARQMVDRGRWIFNWFENDAARRSVRESRPGFRSLGRDLLFGYFSSRITPDGIVVGPAAVPPAPL